MVISKWDIGFLVYEIGSLQQNFSCTFLFLQCTDLIRGNKHASKQGKTPFIKVTFARHCSMRPEKAHASPWFKKLQWPCTNIPTIKSAITPWITRMQVIWLPIYCSCSPMGRSLHFLKSPRWHCRMHYLKVLYKWARWKNCSLSPLRLFKRMMREWFNSRR